MTSSYDEDGLDVFGAFRPPNSMQAPTTLFHRAAMMNPLHSLSSPFLPQTTTQSGAGRFGEYFIATLS